MRKSLVNFILAVVVYAVLGVWLFWGHFWRFDKLDMFIIPFAVIGACGCYVLSLKWIKNWGLKVSAGGFYGFSSLALWFLRLNVVGGFLVAVLPWLFIPAVFIPERIKKKFQIKLVMWAGPFMFVLILFLLLSLPVVGPYFPIPNESFSLAKLRYLASPLLNIEDIFKLSFYHIGFIGFLAGVVFCTMPRQTGPLLIFLIGLIGGVGIKILNTSPAVWVLFANLGGALAAGVGLENISTKKNIKGLFFVLIVVDILITGKILTGNLF